MKKKMELKLRMLQKHLQMQVILKKILQLVLSQIQIEVL